MLTWLDDQLDGLELTFLPLIPTENPWWWIMGLTVLAVVFLLLPTIRLLRGTVWRWFAAAAVIVTLINPVVQRELREPLSTIVLLFEDVSASMRIGGRGVQAKDATDQLVAQLGALNSDDQPIDVRRIRFGEGRSDNGTQLLPTLNSTIAQTPNGQIGGIFVVSDGQVTDAALSEDTVDSGSITDAVALPEAASLNALIVGEDAGLQDRRLTVMSAPRFGLVGEAVNARVRIDDSGDLAGVATLILRRDGQVIRRLGVDTGREFDVALTPETGGRNLFELEVEPLSGGEVTAINNRAAFVVNGVRERLRVLLVSGQPHQAERAWRNLLKSDPAVDLVHFTILRPADRRDTTPVDELSLIAFPVRELFSETLSGFDLIVFDQYPRRGILPSNYFTNIVNYVRNGGSIFVASGPAYASPATIFASPLRDILPAAPTGLVRTEPYLPRLSELGGKHPVTNRLEMRNIPGAEGQEIPTWGRWHRLIEATATRGDVLMTDDDNRPLLMLDRIGEGRIVQLLSDNLWLWARGYEGGGPHAELLRRAAHWAMFEPELDEERLLANADADSLTVEQRTLGTASREVQITDPTGVITRLPLADQGDGRATGRLAVGVDGVYTVEAGGETTRVPVGVINPVEFRDPLATQERLGPLVANAGGWIGDAAAAATPTFVRNKSNSPSAPQVVDRRAYRVLGLSSFSLLPAWLGLLLALGFTLLGWWRESR